MADDDNRHTPRSDTALLIIDMVSTWDFPDGDKLLAEARRIAPAITTLKRRCSDLGIPIIYANDNLGRWNMHFEALIDAASANDAHGADVTRQLAPEPRDYFVLKPKHSAFYGTVLEVLLRQLRVRRLLLAGVSSDQCVMTTLSEARMRDLDVVVPLDCVATQTEERQRAALWQYREVHNVDSPLAADLQLG